MVLRVAVAGEFYSSNVGDQLLCQGMASLIQDVRDSCSIRAVDISGRPALRQWEVNGDKGGHPRNTLPFVKSQVGYYAMRAPGKLKMPTLHSHFSRTLKGEDLLVIAGGQLFMDRSSFPLKLGLLLKVAAEHDVPAAIFACGAYSNWHPRRQKTLGSALRNHNVKYVGVRDAISQAILSSSFGVGARLNLDPVFGFSFPRSNRPTIYPLVFVVAEPAKAAFTTGCSQEEVQRLYRSVLSRIPAESIVMTTGEMGDRRYLREVTKKLVTRGDLHVDVNAQSPASFVSSISNCDSVVSGRLHPILVALCMGKKALPLRVDTKIDSVLDTLGLGAPSNNRYYTDIDSGLGAGATSKDSGGWLRVSGAEYYRSMARRQVEEMLAVASSI